MSRGRENSMADVNRLEITEWRVLFDDEDCLNCTVLSAGDETPATTVIGLEQAHNYTSPLVWEWDDPEGIDNAAQVINSMTIADGQLLTSHDGRVFRVTITEAEGNG